MKLQFTIEMCVDDEAAPTAKYFATLSVEDEAALRGYAKELVKESGNPTRVSYMSLDNMRIDELVYWLITASVATDVLPGLHICQTGGKGDFH